LIIVVVVVVVAAAAVVDVELLSVGQAVDDASVSGPRVGRRALLESIL
jgi:hypothetical protein